MVFFIIIIIFYFVELRLEDFRGRLNDPNAKFDWQTIEASGWLPGVTVVTQFDISH